jgi:hypothetical protein
LLRRQGEPRPADRRARARRLDPGQRPPLGVVHAHARDAAAAIACCSRPTARTSRPTERYGTSPPRSPARLPTPPSSGAAPRARSSPAWPRPSSASSAPAVRRSAQPSRSISARTWVAGARTR